MKDEDGFRPIYSIDFNEETEEQREASLGAMRSAAKKSVGTIKTNNVVQAKLDNEGPPNSNDRLYNKDGSVKQERVYGPNGKPLLDTDWNHGGVGHVFPHTHEWKDGERQDGVPFQGHLHHQDQCQTLRLADGRQQELHYIGLYRKDHV